MTEEQKLRGSQRWLQVAVNRCPDIIDGAVADAIGLASGETIEWVSPLESDAFREYRDQEFLDRLGATLDSRALGEFRPRRGPWGDQRGIALGLLILTFAKDAGGAIGEGLLPGLNLARVDFVPAASWATVSSPFTTSSATLALKAGLCFLRPFDISHSFPIATAALSLGAGLSLSYLSDFPGPHHSSLPRPLNRTPTIRDIKRWGR